MISVRQTDLYLKVLKELNYSFGDVFIFDGFVISEIKEGINFSWNDHAKYIVEDVMCFLGTDGSELIYISNRINSYAVVAIDWLKFFKHNYALKAYCIVSEKKAGVLNSMIEKLFFTKKIKHFNTLYEAINFVKKGLIEIE